MSWRPVLVVEETGVAGENYRPGTSNAAWARAPLCKLQKGCIRLVTASEKVFQLLAHGRWFSLGTPASSISKTGRHDITEILFKVVLKHQNSKSNQSRFDRITDVMVS